MEFFKTLRNFVELHFSMLYYLFAVTPRTHFCSSRKI